MNQYSFLNLYQLEKIISKIKKEFRATHESQPFGFHLMCEDERTAAHAEGYTLLHPRRGPEQCAKQSLNQTLERQQRAEQGPEKLGTEHRRVRERGSGTERTTKLGT